MKPGGTGPPSDCLAQGQSDASPELDRLLQAFMQGCGGEMASSVPSLELSLRLQRLVREEAVSDPPSDEPAALPARLGMYEIVGYLRSGGMGEVYRARHVVLERDVALKVLTPRRASSPLAIERFKREIRLLAALNHPHVVRAFDAASLDGVLYLAMELVDGVDLKQLVQQHALSRANGCELIRQAALGLEAIHEQGVVHRDIKPSNLMLTRQGTVKLVDFGLAFVLQEDSDLTSRHTRLGTELFMSPEQMLGYPEVDARTDVYSLGRTLQFVLGGGPQPSEASSETDGALRDLPPALAGLLEEMLAMDPRQRLGQACEVAERLLPFSRDAQLDVLCRQVLGSHLASFADVSTSPRDAETAASPETRAVSSSRSVLSRATAWMIIPAIGFLLAALAATTQWPSVARRSPAAQSDSLETGPSLTDTAPAVSPRQVPERNPFHPDRELQTALWVLSRRGTVTVNSLGRSSQGRTVSQIQELLEPPFVIQVINLWKCGVTDDEMRALSNLRDLNGLHLSDDTITDACLQALHPSWQMKWLYLECPQLTDSSLAALRPYQSSLENLDLSYTSITDDGLRHLEGFQSLREVVIRATAVSDRGVALLAQLPALVSVDLSMTRISDAALTALSQCPHLRKVQLRGTRVTDAGLRRLHDLPLDVLAIEKTQVTAAAVAQFRARQPQCKVSP